MESSISPGTVVGGYRIDEMVGQGGMAQVYKAWNSGLHRHEALKVLPPHMTFDHSFVERFLTEARTAAGLRHPHIATIYTVSQPNEPQPFFAMELVEGGDLSELIRQRGQMPWREVLPILRQIAGALDYAHSHGIIHRDVKPANILLEDDGHGRLNVKVVDFGIARAQEAGDGARLTKTGMIVGTPEYMSPEQGGSGLPVDHRTDLYSLSVIAYEMSCGHPPFAVGPNGTAMTVIMAHIQDTPRAPLEQVPTLPLAVNAAILKALAKDPADRFASCTAFLDSLEGVVPVAVPTGTSVLRNPAEPTLPRQKVSSPPWASLGLVGLLLLGGILVALGIAKGSHSAPTETSAATASLNSASPNPVSNNPVSNNPVSSQTKVKVPDLAGMKESQARDFVAGTSLHLEEVTDASPTVPAGHVVSQFPDAGAQVSPSETIRIRVSTGPAPEHSYPAVSTSPSPIGGTSSGSDATDIVSLRRLTESDLIGKSDWDLTLMRNTVYARHGYRFHRADLSSYFSGKTWYSPTTDDQNAVHGLFTSLEQYNVAFLSAYAKSHPGSFPGE